MAERSPTPLGAFRIGDHTFRINTSNGPATLDFIPGRTEGTVKRDSGAERAWSRLELVYAQSHPYPRPIDMTTQEYQNVLNLIGTLTQSVQSLKNTVDGLVNSQQMTVNASAARVQNISVDTQGTIEKPSKFKGDGAVIQNAAAARAFIASFTNYAQNNTKLSPNGVMNEEAWIQSFLSFMEGPAREWAVPYIEAYVEKKKPWKDWEECKKAFKTRFSVISSEETARDRIEKIKQGSQSLPAYAAEFDAVGKLTGYGPAELMRRFRRGLDPKFSEKLAIRGQKYTTLDDLIEGATQLYNDLYEEDRRHKSGSTSSGNGYQGEPMEIDALRQGSKKNRFDFLKWMRGRCYGCGSADHTKKDCPRVKPNMACSYCGRLGHFQDVCSDKFLGLDKGRGFRTPTPGPASTQEKNIRASTSEEDKGADLAARMDKIVLQMKELNAAKAEIEKELADFL